MINIESMKIDKNNIHKYGVIKPGDQNKLAIKIDDIVEKPAAQDAPSDMAVCGRYILNPAIFKHLKLTKSDKSGEIQLTDAIKSLLDDEDIFAKIHCFRLISDPSGDGLLHIRLDSNNEDWTFFQEFDKLSFQGYFAIFDNVRL